MVPVVPGCIRPGTSGKDMEEPERSRRNIWSDRKNVKEFTRFKKRWGPETFSTREGSFE